jgi:hypothetical protein
VSLSGLNCPCPRSCPSSCSWTCKRLLRFDFVLDDSSRSGWVACLASCSLLGYRRFQLSGCSRRGNRTVIRPITWSSDFTISLPARVNLYQRLHSIRNLIYHGKPSVRLGCLNDDLALIALCEAVRKEGGVDRWPNESLNWSKNFHSNSDGRRYPSKKSTRVRVFERRWEFNAVNWGGFLKPVNVVDGKVPSVRFLEEMQRREFQFGNVICKCEIHRVALDDH